MSSKKSRSAIAKKAVKTRRRRERNTKLVSSEVVDAIVEGESTGLAGKKAAGTRLLNRYLDQQEKNGKDRVRIHAAIKAHVTRRAA